MYILDNPRHNDLRLLANDLVSCARSQKLTITHQGILPFEPSNWMPCEVFAPGGLLHHIITPEGEWIMPPLCENPLTMSTEAAKHTALTVLSPIQEAAQLSLEIVNWYGYSDHGPQHVSVVTNRTQQLLESAGTDERTIVRGIIAAAGHDLGNLVSRDVHSLISPLLLARVFPEVTRSPKDWAVIQKAIELHDAAVYRDVVDAIVNESFQRKLTILRELYGLEGLALIIADKTDIGRHRVNRKARNEDALAAHVYSEIDLFMQTVALYHNALDRTFTWKLAFNPIVSITQEPELSELVDHSTINNGVGRLKLSPLSHERTTAVYPISLFDSIRAKVFGIHLDRIELTILAAFALYPDITCVKICFVDSEPCITSELVVYKETLSEQIRYLKQTFHRRKQ